MNHFNYFENIRKQKNGMNLPLMTVIVITVAALTVAGFYCVMKLRIPSLRSELDKLSAIKSDPVYIQNENAARYLENALTETQDSYLFLRLVGELTEAGSTVDDSLIVSLFSCFPTGTRVVKITVSGKDIAIEGLANNLQSAITVEMNLQKNPDFSAVFVPLVQADSHTDINGPSAVSFSVRLTLNTGEGGASE